MSFDVGFDKVATGDEVLDGRKGIEGGLFDRGLVVVVHGDNLKWRGKLNYGLIRADGNLNFKLAQNQQTTILIQFNMTGLKQSILNFNFSITKY